MSTATIPTVSVDDITPIGAVVPAGRYQARLLTATGDISKKGNPMVTATYVVTGDKENGGEVKIWYPLTVTRKGDKTYASGVIDAKRTFAAVGKPLPPGFAFPAIITGDDSVDEGTKQRVADTGAALYGKRLKGIEVEILIINDGELKDESGSVRKDSEGNVLYRTRAQVVGSKNAAPAVAVAAPTETFDFGDD